MSDQSKQLAELKKQILEQISDEELETAVGAHKDYITVQPGDDVTPRHFPVQQMNTGARTLPMNTGSRPIFPQGVGGINTGAR